MAESIKRNVVFCFFMEKPEVLAKFRREFKKKWFWDINVFVFALGIVCAFGLIIPVLHVSYGILPEYLLGILIAVDLVFTAFLWYDLKKNY